MIRFLLVQNLQGRTRLAKWYMECAEADKHAIEAEVHRVVSTRDLKLANFVEFNVGKQTFKLVYRRYADLYFVLCVDPAENELSLFEVIHLFVEVLDKYFGNVCELDLVMHFSKAYSLLDELVIAGEVQELCVDKVVRKVQDDDKVADVY